jgi:hypothetical protein
VRIGVAGARANAWSSGMQRDMGEGRWVYLHDPALHERAPDAPTLEPIPPEEAATVAEQDACFEEWVASRRRAPSD